MHGVLVASIETAVPRHGIATPESLILIASADLGPSLGLLSPGLRAGTIMLVAVSAVASPILFRWLAPPVRREVPEREVPRW
jgi:hypothetical protein